MSKKVDERVVEMRFDNAQFESGVKTTMSTLDKLKAALKFPSSTKSLDSISNAAKKVDFSGMQKGIETVNARFSAMQVVGMTALSNITSAALRAGANLVKSFTIEPITQGFREYELQMNSIQTILANTKSKGTTMSDVTAALDELNEYADLTIYNFSEMTKNIGTFTAAGVDLNTSVNAIKGIANLGAMSSSTSSQVSTAMYQLSQALATGRVSLMDWNSVVNAGMGGEQFQNALKRTAENFGYDVDGMIKKYGSFRESLTQGGWLTAEVLTETLNQIGGAYDATALKAKGYSDDQIAAILDLAETAANAATEVKTFTQLMDTLKEAVGSGFATMWRNIFGDFEQAKDFFSGLHDMLEPIVTGPIDAMNAVIEGAMGKGGSRWSEFTGQLDKAGVSIDSFQKKLGEVASAKGVDLSALINEYGSLEKAMASGKITSDMVSEALSGLASSTDLATESTRSLAEWQKVVDDVWLGVYGNIDTGRMERLAAAGWEYAEVQKLVNMTVDGHRLTLEDLSAAQIESMGYTKEQAEALANLAAEAKKSGGDINTLINDILAPKRSGRELFLEGLENVLMAILKPLQAVGKAFGEVFGMDSDGLYKLIEGFNEFSKAIVMAPADLEKLQSTLKGVFSIVHLLATGFGNTLTFALKAVNAVLAPFGTDLLSITSIIGEAIYYFDQWVTSGTLIEDVLSGIGDVFSWIIEPMSGFFEGFASLPEISTALEFFGGLLDGIFGYFKKFNGLGPGTIFKEILRDVQDFLGGFQGAFNKIKSLTWEDVLAGLTDFGKKVGGFFTNLIADMKEIGPDIIEGLQNGLLDGAEGIVKFLQDLGTKIIEAICAVLGIHSPSTVFFEIGKNIVEGLVNGIKYLSGEVSGVIRDLVEDIKYALSGIDWGVVLPVAGAVGSFAILYQMTDALQGFAQAAKDFASPMKSISNLGGALTTTVNGFNELMGFTQSNTSIKFKQMAEGIKILAEAIAILAGSVVALTLVDTGKMWIAVGAIGALAVIIGVLAAALNHFANGGTVLQSLQLNSTLLSIAGSFLLLSVTAKILGSMDASSVEAAQEMLLTFAGVISVLVLIGQWGGKKLDSVAAVLSKVGVAFLLLGVASRLLGGMDREQMDTAQEMLLTFAGVISILVLISQWGKGLNKAAAVISKVGTAFLLLGIAAKIMGTMSPTEMNTAISAITAFGFVVAGLIAATKLAGDKSVDTIGSTILKIAGAIAILGATAVILGSVDTGQLIKGGIAVAALGVIVVGLMKLVQMMGPGEAAKVGATLLAMSLAIGVLGGIAVLLGLVDPGNLAKGVIAVGFLAAMMVAMTKATAGASDVKGTMMGIAVAIGVMAASVAVLSFIDPSRLVVATAAMTVLMGMFAVVAKSASNVQTSLPVMITMVAAIAILGAVVAVLANMPVEGVIASAASLTVLLLSLAASLKIISTIGSISTNVLVSVGILTAVMAALGLVLAMMSALNVQSAIPNAIALSTLLLSMSAAMVVLGTVTSVSMTVMGAVGILTAIMAGLGLVLAMMSALNVQSAIPNAIALSTLALAMSGVMVILSAIGPMATAAIPAAGAMAAVIGIMAGIVAAAGAIAQIPGIDFLVGEGASLLQKIGEAIGGFIGGLVGGALDAATSVLPSVGQSLSQFAMNLLPFVTTMQMIDPSITDSCANLAGAILALTGAGVIDAIPSLFGAGSMIGSIGEQLIPFGQAMADFAGTLDGVNLGALLIGSQAAKAIADMANAMPKEGGILDSIFGSTVDLGTFGTQLVNFGNGMKSYAESIAGVDVASIQNSIPAAEGLAELANKLPAEGGLMSSIFGTKTNLSSFGTQLVDFGDGLSQYASKVADLDTEAIQNSIPAAEALNQLAQQLPSDGGLVGSIFGSDGPNLSNFGGQLEAFGTALGKYATSVAELDTEGINTSVDATNRIIGLLRSLIGLEDIGTGIENASKIKDLGDAIKQYSEKIADVDPTKMINSATAVNGLKDAINNLVGLDSSGVAGFQSAIDKLASTNVQGLIDAFSNVDLSSVGANIMTSLASGLKSGSSTVISAITTVVTAMQLTLTIQAALLVPIGAKYMESLATGVKGSSSLFTSSITVTLMAAANSIRGYYSSFYSAGAYISQGLAAGMRSRLSQIRSAASAMAQEAARATRAAAAVKSPSRVFMEIGDYLGQGLVIGMENEQKAIYNAGYAMGDSAYDGIKSTMSTLGDVFSSDFDVNPTIRPVLDLSDVKNGADSINSLFDNTVPMSVLGRVDSINRSMNDRIQNGTFNDVVKAVDRLRAGLSEIGGPSYTINGITYDDGTNIANTIGDLTRQIRIERRV